MARSSSQSRGGQYIRLMETTNMHMLFLRKKEKLLEANEEEQPKIAIDDGQYTVHTADNRNLHRKLLSTPPNSQRSPKMEMSPKKHQLEGPGGNILSASEKARKVVEGIISESKSKVPKVETDEEGRKQ